MKSIYGHYTSPDEGVQYEYDAAWRQGSDGLTWNATLRAEGQLPLYPTGSIEGAEGATVESLVHTAIAGAIERRAVARRSRGTTERRLIGSHMALPLEFR
jgi:hypothetical protein